MKQCLNCLQWKDESEFDWRYTFEFRDVICRLCHTEYGDNIDPRLTCPESVRMRDETKEYVYNYLASHPCALCGESDPQVLEFHDGGGNGWILSHLLGGGNALMALQAEIAKCRVLCVNCHKKILSNNPGPSKSRK